MSAMPREISADDLAEYDELIETLIALRRDPPDGLTQEDLPNLIDLSDGDPHILAVLERRLEIALGRAGTRGTA